MLRRGRSVAHKLFLPVRSIAWSRESPAETRGVVVPPGIIARKKLISVQKRWEIEFETGFNCKPPAGTRGVVIPPGMNA